MSALKLLDKNHLAFDFFKLPIRELFFVKEAPCEIYAYINEKFVPIIGSHTVITPEILKELLLKGVWYLFIPLHHYERIKSDNQEILRKLSRSLSIGEPFKKGKDLSHLLSLNLNYLYRDPSDDEMLELIYQSAKNLALFLINTPEVLAKIYKDLLTQKHHYTITQPLLSSILLLGYLLQVHQFSEKEVESLFLTSYFKDIGMCMIPEEKFAVKELSDQDRLLFLAHPQFSSKVLEGRIPLNTTSLQIISHHHLVGPSSNIVALKKETLFGIETLLITIMDTIAAATTDRPYRKKAGLYETLELVRPLMVKDYYQEFKLLISFVQKFFI